MRKQLLIVDDDPLFVDFVKEVLTVEEIDVISAPNGRAALSLVDVTPPSFILSDFEMPKKKKKKKNSSPLPSDHRQFLLC